MTHARQVEGGWLGHEGMKGGREEEKKRLTPGMASMRALQSITVWSGVAGSLTAQR